MVEPADSARTWLDALQDGVVILDASARIIDVNAAVTALTGRARAELLGADALAQLHPDDVERAAQKMVDELVEPDVTLPLECRLLGVHGWIPVEITGRRVDLETGAGLAITIRDMRRRALLDAEVRRERSFLRTVLDEVDVGIIACDENGLVSVYSRAAGLDAPEKMHLDEFLRNYQFFEPDGHTPLDPLALPLARAFRGEHVRDQEYAVVGVDGGLHFRRANGEPLHDGAGEFVGAVVAIHDITEQRQAERALRRQALHDGLTGLPNRVLFLDRLTNALDRSLRSHENVAVFFIDLDRFKVVNDGLGHGAGDALLIDVARGLDVTIRPGDTVARLGGDEFVILCEPIKGRAEAGVIADRLRQAVAEPIVIDGNEIRVTASIGVAMGSGGASPEAILRDADTAMYRAKDLGRDSWVMFDDRLRRRVLERIDTEQLLQRALDEDHLRLLYQPFFASAGGALAGAEALVRVHDERRGLIEPAHFMDVAEESGLVSRLDQWVLAEVCKQAAMWGAIGQPFVVTWNVSARTVGRGDFVPFVLGQIDEHGLNPAALGLELTETTLVSATSSTRHSLTRLRECGVAIGLDEFGTGYSSLTNLRDFAVSFVKIDRSFTSGLRVTRESAAIVRATIELAHALGLTVIAEGVTDQEQVDWLTSAQCDYLQGLLFGPPMEASSLTALMGSPAGLIRKT